MIITFTWLQNSNVQQTPLMMRRLQLPRCSVRQDTAHMAGAIFMSNSETREHCFGTSVFGLPPEYEHFVASVKQGMPLFLFDYTDRKLYGVFEATSDGGMDIRRGAFGSSGRTYPAQVCFNIVWKCRPLTEDEFFPAIEENYYNSKKFYFDLSYQQVVNLYGLFEKKRVERPIFNYSKVASFEKEQSSRRPDKRSLSPNISPLSADHSHTLLPSSSPKMSTVETSCSASTSMHPIVPRSFETQPNVSMPLVTKHFGVQIAPIHSNQLQLPYHSHEHLGDVSTIDGTSTQLAAPCSQTLAYHPDQFIANQSYPLSHDYLQNRLSLGCSTQGPSHDYMQNRLSSGLSLGCSTQGPSHDYMQNRLSSGCSTQGPTDGVRLSVKQSYEGSSSLYSRYLTQVPTGDDRSYLTPYVPSYPHLSLASPQTDDRNLGDDYDINCEQCKANYASESEHQHLNRTKSLTPPELTRQGLPAYPEAPEVSAISQQKESFTGYIPIPDCTEVFEKEQPRRDFNRDVSGSSGSGNDTGGYISDQPYANHDVGAESNMTVPSHRLRKTVFSRMSMKPQPPSQEIPGPSLNQLLYSLSKRTEQWSSKNAVPTEYVCKVSAQDIDRPYSPAELNLPGGLDEEESADTPFFNFKRRSKATSLDTIAGNEVSDNKVKRRKLVRPSFGQSSNTASAGKELQENLVMERNPTPAETVGNNPQENVMMERNHSPVETVGNKLQESDITERNLSPAETVGNKLQENSMMEMNHSPVETGGNKFYIDLNEPASADNDMVEDDSIGPSPAVIVKAQTEKPSEVNINQPGCSNSNELISKQDDSGAPTEKVTLDLNITDLNTMDEAKLQALLGSSLLQALDKLRNGKSNDSEKANKPSICAENSAVKMEMKPDASTNRRYN